MTSTTRILIYLLRHDLRLQDNPILHRIVTQHQSSNFKYTHLLPIYVFPAQQVEISGFLASSEQRSPYPEARSQVAGFWRCGKHRAKFLAESVFDLKGALEGKGSGLIIRVGMVGEVVKGIIEWYKDAEGKGKVEAVWMTGEEGVEEMREERDVRSVAQKHGIELEIVKDEKYFVDDDDVPVNDIKDLPELFTAYRKKCKPLRDIPRNSLEIAEKERLPSLPSDIPPQPEPFNVPKTLDEMLSCLLTPLDSAEELKDPPKWPKDAKSAHPFKGGEQTGHERIRHLITSGSMTRYKSTRNGMLGEDFSTKLSAWLALGCITSRQIHWYLLAFEDGNTSLGKETQGYGKGENAGTGWVRFELLWRDYMRLLGRKHRHKLFQVEGTKNDTKTRWKYLEKDPQTQEQVKRFLEGTTGTGLIDASMRELYLTGYTSNRARQNVGSFLGRHLGIDWRIGAEWYEMQLVDYDVHSNWMNWQYVAVTDRTFNPIKQSFDYDKEGMYIKTWVEELRDLKVVDRVFQAWKVGDDEKAKLGLEELEWVKKPLKRIDYGGGEVQRKGGRDQKGNWNGVGEKGKGHKGEKKHEQ